MEPKKYSLVDSPHHPYGLSTADRPPSQEGEPRAPEGRASFDKQEGSTVLEANRPTPRPFGFRFQSSMDDRYQQFEASVDACPGMYSPTPPQRCD